MHTGYTQASTADQTLYLQEQGLCVRDEGIEDHGDCLVGMLAVGA